MSKQKIILLHQDEILHYRVAIYNYFSKYFAGNYDFSVMARSIQKNNPHPVDFDYIEHKPNFYSIAKNLIHTRPDIIILFVNLKHHYLFPVIFLAKILGIKLIYWGHGKDVQDQEAFIKNALYDFEFSMVDKIILYSGDLIQHVARKHKDKIHIANNTLATTRKCFDASRLGRLKNKYAINEETLIIFVGRVQQYKRIDDLINAFAKIKRSDIGLLIIGSDDEQLIDHEADTRIHCLGAIHGDELAMFLSLADIYCMPGAIGLSIVDAFQYGLPIVTEDVQHGPEIMYLKNEVNGFMVPVGDVDLLAEKLELLSTDVDLRNSMSAAAVNEISVNGSVDNMCEGFLSAIRTL